MEGKLGGKIMKEFLALRPKMCGYLTDDGCVDEKAKDTENENEINTEITVKIYS